MRFRSHLYTRTRQWLHGSAAVLPVTPKHCGEVGSQAGTHLLPSLPSDSSLLTDLRCVCSLHRCELQLREEGEDSDMAWLAHRSWASTVEGDHGSMLSPSAWMDMMALRDGTGGFCATFSEDDDDDDSPF